MMKSVLLVFLCCFFSEVSWSQETTTTSSVTVTAPLPETSVKDGVSVVSSPKAVPASSPSDLVAQALSEKLPQVSASILRTELQRESNPEQRKKIALRLGQILVMEGRSEEALTVLDSQELASDPMVLFWKSQALLSLGRAAEAHTLLLSCLAMPSLGKEYLEAVSIGLARSDRALGNFDAAITDLEAIPSDASLASLALEERCSALLALKRNAEVEQLLKNISSKQFLQQPRLAYLFALAAWQRDDKGEALRRFTLKLPAASSVNAKGTASSTSKEILMPDRWASSALVSGNALCHVALNKPSEAKILLEKYLQENPKSSQVPELMAELEQVYLLENNNDTTLFRKWSKEVAQEPLRASYAYLPLERMLRRLRHNDKADELLVSFLHRFPDHPLVPEARCDLAESKLRQGESTEALTYLTDQPMASPLLRGRSAFLKGLAEASLKHPDQAEKYFSEAALLDGQLAAAAFYNQTLSHLVASPQNISSTSLDLLKSDLSSLHQEEAQKAISDASGGHEREEYIAVLNTDQGDRATAPLVIKSARAFLVAHPQSPFVNEVRMKLGEALLRNGAAREARVELEKVGHAEPSSELGRQSLLLAAQAAARSMDPKSIDDAIMLLEQVAQNSAGSSDRWQARLEQASLKNAQALPLEAIAIDDQILAGADVPADLRRTAQMAKGDTLSGLGTKDPKNYEAAVAVWRELANAADVSPHWRNQALCKIGLIEEKLGDNDAALASYYEAMKTPRIQEPETLWHDKAAFEAARLLEVRRQWSDAIALYQQIIAEGGARSAEAQARISKLRLENFLWEK